MDSLQIPYSLISLRLISRHDTWFKHQESTVSMHQKDQELAWPHKRSHKRCYTPPQCYWHPSNLRVSYKSKINVPLSILTLKDPMITEISELLLDQGFTRSQCIPSEVNQVLALAKNSISTITTKTLSRKCTSVHRETRVKHWNDKLSELTVQSKFTDIT